MEDSTNRLDTLANTNETEIRQIGENEYRNNHNDMSNTVQESETPTVSSEKVPFSLQYKMHRNFSSKYVDAYCVYANFFFCF